MKKKDASFEEGLARLEDLVESLEDRTVSLDRALAAFEEGLKLSSALRKKLDEAAGKVEILSRDLAGRPVTRPFGAESLDEEGPYADEEEGDDDDDEE